MLVADPKHTKINVKAELSKSGNELGGCVSDCSTHPKPIDLPLGVSSSMINQLQVNFASRRLLLSPFSSVSIYPSFFIKIAWVVSISLYEALNEVKAILVTEIEAV